MLANFGAYEPTNSFATCTWDTGSTTLVSHMTRPRLDQRTLHREVFIRQQSRIAGLLQHGLKQILGNLTLQQPVPILREHGHIPDAVIHLKTHGPAKQRVVLKLLHQHPFTANRIQNLEQQSARELLGCN
jgi:hypothetical protein